MKNFITYFIILISALILYSCKKYPEDDKRFLFKSPKERITSHKWELKSLTIDGADSTDHIYHQFEYISEDFSFRNCSFHFDKIKYDSDWGDLAGKHPLVTIPSAIAPVGSWHFKKRSNKNYLILGISSRDCTFRLNSGNVMEIIRLDSKELILESIEDTRKIRFEFNAQ